MKRNFPLNPHVRLVRWLVWPLVSRSVIISLKKKSGKLHFHCYGNTVSNTNELQGCKEVKSTYLEVEKQGRQLKLWTRILTDRLNPAREGHGLGREGWEP